MNNEIGFSTIWKVFLNSWKKILIITLVAMLLMGLFTQFVIKKEYSSSATFYVINVSPDNNYVTTSLIEVIEHLSNDYIQIIKSDILLKPVSEALVRDHGLHYSPAQIKAMIGTAVTPETSIFSIKITNEDKDHAYLIAETIAKEAPRVIREFTSLGTAVQEDGKFEEEEIVMLEKIRVLNEPKRPTTHESPNLVLNVLLAAIGAAGLSYVAFFMLSFFNTVISSEDDIKELTSKYPVLGSIPRWE